MNNERGRKKKSSLASGHGEQLLPIPDGAKRPGRELTGTHKKASNATKDRKGGSVLRDLSRPKCSPGCRTPENKPAIARKGRVTNVPPGQTVSPTKRARKGGEERPAQNDEFRNARKESTEKKKEK